MRLANEARKRLTDLLSAQGFDRAKPDLLQGWRVFQQFAQEPVDCGRDCIFIDYRIIVYRGESNAVLSFVRQFSDDFENGFWIHFEQLHFDLIHTPVESLPRLPMTLSKYDTESFADYFEAVEKSEAFQKVLPLTDWACWLWESDDPNRGVNEDLF